MTPSQARPDYRCAPASELLEAEVALCSAAALCQEIRLMNTVGAPPTLYEHFSDVLELSSTLLRHSNATIMECPVRRLFWTGSAQPCWCSSHQRQPLYLHPPCSYATMPLDTTMSHGAAKILHCKADSVTCS